MSGTNVAQLSFHSPIGDLTVTEVDNHIVSLDWGWAAENKETALLREAHRWLNEYFDGHCPTMTLPLTPPGTDFQQKVWKAITDIPMGQTQSYQQLAQKLGSHPRAVGAACGRNPIPLLIPCHRVVAKDGKLTGYSGEGGVETKVFLLNLEKTLT